MTSTSGAEPFWKVLDAVKGRGFWRFHIYPISEPIKRFADAAVLKDAVRKAAVEYRGWDHPHIPDGRQDVQGWYYVENRLEAWVRFSAEIEVWRFYNTGQFIHYVAVHEDWLAEDHWHSGQRPEPGQVLDAIEVVLRFSEFYAFAARLITTIGPDCEFAIERSLSNMANRQLVLLAPGRMPLREDYRCYASGIQLEERRVPGRQLLDSFREFAIEDSVEVFKQFNWERPNIGMARDSQSRLFERRL